jgi:hypothetical protein
MVNTFGPVHAVLASRQFLIFISISSFLVVYETSIESLGRLGRRTDLKRRYKLQCMEENKLEEIISLLNLQKQALMELAVELVTPPFAKNRINASVEMQKAMIFHAKIERQVRGLAAQH